MPRRWEWNTSHPLNMVYFTDIQFAPNWPVLLHILNFDLTELNPERVETGLTVKETERAIMPRNATRSPTTICSSTTFAPVETSTRWSSAASRNANGAMPPANRFIES